MIDAPPRMSARVQDRTPVRLPLPAKHHPWLTPLAGIAFVTLIATADWLAGPTVSLEMLYAIAVMAAAWVGGTRDGLLAAGLAATESLAAHVMRLDPIMVTPGVIWNAATRFAALVLIAALVGRLRTVLIEQRHHAMTDPLTGALNRRAFQIAAERERHRAQREQTPLTLAYLDLDGFKAVNDRLGHAVGDAMLTRFADTITRTIRGSDLLCRIGGDEFAVLLPATDARSAVVVLNRIRGALSERCKTCPEQRMTASIGVATFHEPPDTVDEMISQADQLMYQAKANGKDRIVGSVISGNWHRWGERTREDARGVTTDARAVSG